MERFATGESFESERASDSICCSGSRAEGSRARVLLEGNGRAGRGRSRSVRKTLFYDSVVQQVSRAIDACARRARVGRREGLGVAQDAFTR